MSIIEKINCVHCGAPIEFEPGEILTTCRYCGFTQVIETGNAFTFAHSMFLSNYNEAQVEEIIRKWMQGGFTKPGDLARKSRITEKNLIYVPFWLLEVYVSSTYKGIFERLTPPVVKEGKIEKHYNWLVLARKATLFPTRSYDVPLKGKIPYDFRKIEDFAQILNSEVGKNEAMEKTKQQVEDHHRFLIDQSVDKIIEMYTVFKFNDAVYLHAPFWFVVYEYKKENYRIILDSTTGVVIKGDIPTGRLELF